MGDFSKAGLFLELTLNVATSPNVYCLVIVTFMTYFTNDREVVLGIIIIRRKLLHC